MTQPEGPYIPQVQPASIEAARRLPYTFAMLKLEQHFLGGWLKKRFIQCRTEFKSAEKPVPMSELEDEVYLAYGAMQHACRRGLPTVQESTIIDYFKTLCPKSALDPDTGKPVEPVDSDTINTILDTFEYEQPYLARDIKVRFEDQVYALELIDNSATFISMTYFMIKETLANPQGHF